jgi:rhodanese-related sulfurtransferase
MGVRDWFRKPYTDLDPDAAHQAVQSGRAVLIDVREPFEWQNGRAPKARHIPLSQLPNRAKEIPADRLVIFACRSGNRSSRAASWHAKQREDVANLKGGMAAWSRAGLPVIAKGGRPGRVT